MERYLEGKVQILGVSVEPPEEGKKFLDRVTRDCEEDRLHIPLDPYPVRLLCDPDAKLIRAVGTENEGHSAGLIVKWAYVSDSAADRPNPVALAKASVAIASGKSPPAATSHTCFISGLIFSSSLLCELSVCKSRESTVPLDSHVKPFDLCPGPPRPEVRKGCSAMAVLRYSNHYISVFLTPDKSSNSSCILVVEIRHKRDHSPIARLVSGEAFVTTEDASARGFELGKKWIDERSQK